MSKSSKISKSPKISSAFFTGCLLAAVAVIGASGATAASGSKSKSGVLATRHAQYARSAGYGRYAGYYNYAGPARARAYAPRFTQPATLPYAPEYGFLRQVPPNAVTGPGYVFVPGKGILGESCDLPTSACSNEYRDTQ
jgi:hypothetical protein